MFKKAIVGKAFNPEEVLVLAAAYDAVCLKMNVQKSDTHVQAAVARTIVLLAEDGLRDTDTLVKTTIALMKKDQAGLSWSRSVTT